MSDFYEPVENSSLKALSFKTTLLLALTSVKTVSELCALLVHPRCVLLCGDHSVATFRLNPSFFLKNIRSSFRSRTIQLEAFCPPPHGDVRGGKTAFIVPSKCVLDCTYWTAGAKERECPVKPFPRGTLLVGFVSESPMPTGRQVRTPPS